MGDQSQDVLHQGSLGGTAALSAGKLVSEGTMLELPWQDGWSWGGSRWGDLGHMVPEPPAGDGWSRCRPGLGCTRAALAGWTRHLDPAPTCIIKVEGDIKNCTHQCLGL